MKPRMTAMNQMLVRRGHVLPQDCKASFPSTREISDATDLFTPPAPIPEGYQLVPIEPTEAMIDAGLKNAIDNRVDNIFQYDVEWIYKAMLAAARSKK